MFYKDEIDVYNVELSGNKVYLNDLEQPTIQLNSNSRYKFDVSHDSMTQKELLFTTVSDGKHTNNAVDDISKNVFARGLPGDDNSNILLITNDHLPNRFHYYVKDISNAGGDIDMFNERPLFLRSSDASKNSLITALHNDLCVEGQSQIKHNAIHSKVKKLGGEYNGAITADTGHSLGEVFLRYISTHLTGHPLGQIIIKNDLSFKEKIDGQGVGTSNVAETLINQLVSDLSENGIGGRKDILHTIFEQMVFKRIERFGVNDSEKVGLPFVKNDKILRIFKL